MNWHYRPAWWSRAGHIRSRLIGLSIIAALPISGMAGTIAWQDYQSVARGAQERAALLDGQVLARYQSVLALVAQRISHIQAHPEKSPCDPSGLEDGGGLLAIDLDGRLTCQAGPLPPLPSTPYPWFEQVRGGAAAASGMLGETGWAAMAFSAPGGGATVAVEPPSWIVQLLPDLPQSGDAVWLLNERSAVLVSRGDAVAALPTAATMVAMIAGRQLAVRAFAASGARYAYATTLLPSGWRLITATSATREHVAALRELLMRLAELTVLLLAGLATLVIGADVAFGQPLRRLSTAVREWQAGNAFDPGDLSGAPDEVLQLAASFRESMASLRLKEMELARSREQQDLLVMEVHHRVKNNLQVIASLLNLQGSRIRVPEAQAEFQAARDRVRALATLHRHLYADGELHTINMRSFLVELCGQLFHAMGETAGDRIKLVIDAPELRMSSDQAVPLALIVTEAVTNSVRYAFPGGRAGRIEVSLIEHDGVLDLTICDDGVGIEAGRPPPAPGSRDGIGLQLIRGFSRQLGATLAVEEGSRGTRYAVRLAGPHVSSAALDDALAHRDTVA